ncbi:MAG: hypothetical protein RCG15_00680 [Candidatus Rickettsia vulgarisii]
MQNQGSFTRGLQIYAHKFRMFNQGMNYSFMVGLVYVAWDGYCLE